MHKLCNKTPQRKSKQNLSRKQQQQQQPYCSFIKLCTLIVFALIFWFRSCVCDVCHALPLPRAPSRSSTLFASKKRKQQKCFTNSWNLHNIANALVTFSRTKYTHTAHTHGVYYIIKLMFSHTVSASVLGLCVLSSSSSSSALALLLALLILLCLFLLFLLLLLLLPSPLFDLFTNFPSMALATNATSISTTDPDSYISCHFEECILEMKREIKLQHNRR